MGEMIYSESDDRTINNAVRHQYRVLTDEEKAAMVHIKDAGLSRCSRLSRLDTGIEASIAKTKMPRGVAVNTDGRVKGLNTQFKDKPS